MPPISAAPEIASPVGKSGSSPRRSGANEARDGVHTGMVVGGGAGGEGEGIGGGGGGGGRSLVASGVVAGALTGGAGGGGGRSWLAAARASDMSPIATTALSLESIPPGKATAGPPPCPESVGIRAAGQVVGEAPS